MTAAATPGRQQYLDIKAEHSDAIVWFRLGDFYEMFDEDARVASAALRITLTSRAFGKDCKVPMCGVPVHAYARFMARLVRQGFRVAVCEQLSPPGKGLVDRKVVRIVTAGTLSEPDLLRPNESNYLAAVTRPYRADTPSLMPMSRPGNFESPRRRTRRSFWSESYLPDPAECLIDPTATLPKFTVRGEKVDHLAWRKDTEEERLRRHLSGASARLIGCEDIPAASAAAGAILGYLDHTNRPLLESLRRLRPYTLNEAVAIDPGTRATPPRAVASRLGWRSNLARPPRPHRNTDKIDCWSGDCVTQPATRRSWPPVWMRSRKWLEMENAERPYRGPFVG